MTPAPPPPAERVAAERAIVRECYDRLFAGESVSAVVRDLNARGAAGQQAALPVSGTGWYRSTFGRCMCRPALAGLLIHHGAVVGELAGVEPIVSPEEWERMCALFAARKLGRPPAPRHLLSGLIPLPGVRHLAHRHAPRQLAPYPDGSPKREYRCRRTRDTEHPGCGRNHIDGLRADQAVTAAVTARLGDPRRAERVAAHLAQVREQRSAIEAEIGRWEQQADDLVTKTATWGVAWVDSAMGPILRRIDTLRAELATPDQPDTASAATADAVAVAAWNEAADRADITAQHALIRRAFPHLTLTMPRWYGDHSPERFYWDGAPTAEPPARESAAG